jgi:hypothetical protein
MDNNLQEKVIQWIESTASKIGDFATEQIPPFITEYLTWKFWEAAFSASMYLIVLVVAGVYLAYWKKIWAWNVKYFDITDGISLLPTLLSAVGVSLLLIFNFPYDEIKDMIQINIAPKVYLLEKASELIKN